MNSRRLARTTTKWLCFHLPGVVAVAAVMITLMILKDGSAGMGDLFFVFVLMLSVVIFLNSAAAHVTYGVWTRLILPPLEARRERRGGGDSPPERRSEWFYLYSSCGLVFAVNLVFGGCCAPLLLSEFLIDPLTSLVAFPAAAVGCVLSAAFAQVVVSLSFDRRAQ